MNQNDADTNQLKTEQLKTDGHAIRRLAESRLAGLNLAEAIESRIQSPVHQQAQNRAVKWPWAMAASVLLVITVLWFQPQPQTTPAVNAPAIEQPVLAESLKDWPQRLEAGINNPLKAEQAAIIADLKLLQKQWLSI